MKIRDLSLSECARILGAHRVGITTTAQIYNWPGKPEGSKSNRWKVPAAFIRDTFGVSETEIVKSLAAERKGAI